MTTLADQVRETERRGDAAFDLAGEILATLRVNERHFFRHDDGPKRELFDALLSRWEELHKALKAPQ